MGGIGVGRVGQPLIRPRRSYDRRTAAIGVIEVDGAVPYTVAAKMILEKFGTVALLKPFLLGSATGALAFAGEVEEVRMATDPKWLMQPEVLGRFEKRKPLVGTACFEGPSRALWEVMREVDPVPEQAREIVDRGLTLGMVETLRMGPFLTALDYIGGRGQVSYLGATNFGSRHKAVFFTGEQAQVEAAKWGAKDYLRGLYGQTSERGEYDGSWFLPLDEAHHDLQFLLPFASNPRPYLGDPAGRDSYLAIEAKGLVAFFTAVNAAAWRGRVRAIAPRELGSATETAILVSPEEDHINSAAERDNILTACARNPNGEKSVIAIHVFHHPKEIFGAHMSEVKPSKPRFSMEGMSIGLVDTVNRGLLYDAMEVLKKYDGVKLIGTRKIGTYQVFMAFAGPQAQIEKALEEIKSRAEELLTAKQRKGELYSLGIIPNPNEEVIRLLPWQPGSEFVETAPEGMVLSDPYYQPGQPVAVIETLGLAHQIAIANAIFQETGIAPVSRYGAGSGLEIFHYASGEEELLRQATAPAFLAQACAGMANTDSMLLNVAYYPEPGQVMWDAIDHQQPVPVSAVQRITDPGIAVGAATFSGMIATLAFLDGLKRYGGVELVGMQKSGGKLVTNLVYGPLAQVQTAMAGLAGDARACTVIGRPHPNLAFFLPRSIRVGV